MEGEVVVQVDLEPAVPARPSSRAEANGRQGEKEKMAEEQGLEERGGAGHEPSDPSAEAVCGAGQRRAGGGGHLEEELGGKDEAEGHYSATVATDKGEASDEEETLAGELGRDGGTWRLTLGEEEQAGERLARYNLQWKVTYCLTLVLAAGFLFPYNSFITAVDYFKVIFGPDVENEITLTYMTSVAVVVAAMAVFGGKPFGLRALMLSYAAFLAFLLLVPSVCFLLVPEPPQTEEDFATLPVRTAYWVTIGSVLVTGVIEGSIQASLYGLGAVFDARQARAAAALGPGLGLTGEQQFYTQGVQLGTAMAGSFVSVNRIVSKLLLEDETEDFYDLQLSIVMYFSICALVECACIVAVLALKRLRYAKLYLLTDVNITEMSETDVVHVALEEASTKEQAVEADDVTGVGLDEDESEVEVDEEGLPLSTDGYVTAKQLLRYWWRSPWSHTVTALMMLRFLRAVRVMKQTWKMALSVGLTFLCTLVVFPGVLVKVPAQYLSQSWLTIVLISAFNFSDFIGKELPAIKLFNKPPDAFVYCMAVGRFVMIPLFLLCVKPYVITNEFIVMVLTIVLGLTTGYTGALAMMRGPTDAADADKGQAGMLMVLSLVIGLDLGALASYILHFVYF